MLGPCFDAQHAFRLTDTVLDMEDPRCSAWHVAFDARSAGRSCRSFRGSACRQEGPKRSQVSNVDTAHTGGCELLDYRRNRPSPDLVQHERYVFCPTCGALRECIKHLKRAGSPGPGCAGAHSQHFPYTDCSHDHRRGLSAPIGRSCGRLCPPV